jgi:DNA-binding CsgD family transcriptional regulator/PAS domain-containing protein
MHADYERLAHAQDVLRAPIDASDPEPWVRAATAAVREVAACDHTLFFLPPPLRFPVTPPRRPPLVWSSDTDPAVPTAYEAALAGGGPAPHGWMPPLLDETREGRERRGGVFHERDLTPRETIENAAFYREVLHPHGLRHLMGLSVDGADGQEYAVVVAYERADAPGFCEETLLRLRLLHPAFEASVRTRTRPHAEMEVREAAFAATVDALDLAVLVVAPDGHEIHWNAALDRLLKTEPEAERVLTAVQRWARALFQNSRRDDGRPVPLVALPCVVHTQRRDYRIGGVQLGPTVLGREGVLVTVERTGLPLPEPSALSERFGLTPREAEVALHLARGRTDRDIAAALTISYSTARRHAERALQKLAVRSRAAVAARICEPPVEPGG